MPKNVYLFQPQYAETPENSVRYWLPYSAGCIWAYVSQFSDIVETYCLKDIIFRREKFANVINRLENPSVCAFSCYVWNENYCLTLAKKIKDLWPNCVIVFGGPQAGSD